MNLAALCNQEDVVEIECAFGIQVIKDMASILGSWPISSMGSQLLYHKDI